MPMSEENKQRWIERLENPDMNKATGRMYFHGNAMCCLGHLASMQGAIPYGKLEESVQVRVQEKGRETCWVLYDPKTGECVAYDNVLHGNYACSPDRS